MRSMKIKLTILSMLAIISVGLFLSGCGAVASAMLTMEVSVGVHSLSFTAREGQVPAPQDVDIGCTYNDDTSSDNECNVDITVSQTESATPVWLIISNDSITGQGSLEVSINTDGLAVGTYHGNIHVESFLPAIDDEEDIAVTLTITSASAMVIEDDAISDESAEAVDQDDPVEDEEL